jgi:hypothetical protein
MMLSPTLAAAVNERCWLRLGALAQPCPVKYTTSLVVNGLLNGLPPPIAQRPNKALPGAFFAIGMLGSCRHVPAKNAQAVSRIVSGGYVRPPAMYRARPCSGIQALIPEAEPPWA